MRKMIFGISLFIILGCAIVLLTETHLQQSKVLQKGEKPLDAGVSDKDTTPPQLQSEIVIDPYKPYEGPQTVEALINTFSEILTDPIVDEKYPEHEWIQMLIDRGITIHNYFDYSGYTAARRALVHLENQPQMWTSDIFGIPPTNNWKTFEAAFIERHIWEYEQYRAAIIADPEITSGFFVGPNKRTLLPGKPGRVYVQKEKNGAIFIGASLTESEQKALLHEGIHPEGYEVLYINEKGNILPVPPPIIPQDIPGTPAHFPSQTMPLVERDVDERVSSEEIPSDFQQNNGYSLRSSKKENTNGALDALSNDERAELKELLMDPLENFSEVPHHTEFQNPSSLMENTKNIQEPEQAAPQKKLYRILDRPRHNQTTQKGEKK